jgi:four helix bundle protein
MRYGAIRLDSQKTLRSARTAVRFRIADDPDSAVSAHTWPVAIALSAQILKCGTSSGANYEEADDGSSDRDSLAKKKIALRETKESRFRLRLIRRAGFLKAEHDPVIHESDELVKILSTIIRNESEDGA